MKTLLVGLGGTGCIVVSRVMKMISNDDPTIQFIGFDTDVNQEEAEGLPIVQTSSSARVGELLMSEPDWEEWFPNNRILKARNMKTGAGQIRVLSRLAFSDTLRRENGSPVELKRALDALFSSAQDAENDRSRRPKQEEVKIMVVSSFAGGTGSGMFIQAALFLRQYIKKNYLSDCRIRGLFALPDVFVKTEKIDRIQSESMYANAYASLKELNAINAICLSQNPDVRGYNLSLPGLFTSENINRLEDKSYDKPEKTTADRKPFDCIFFVDNISTSGTVLRSREEYLDQMSQITYMQIYSPMESLTDSREDNFIMNHMQSDGEAMYCSAGAAKLVYPYEDVVRYCALRSLSETISSRWTLADKEFDRRFNVAKERRKGDKSVPLPKRSDVYIDIIDHHLKSRDKGYTFIRDGASEERIIQNVDSKGRKTGESRETSDRASDFYSTIVAQIGVQYDNDDALKEGIENIGDIQEDIKPFNNTQSYRDAIEAQEKGLNDFLDIVAERIPSLEANICNDIFPIHKLEDPYALKWNINNLLWVPDENNERHALHPMTARYLLYKLQDQLRELEATNKEQVVSTLADIEAYANEDWKPSTKEIDRPYDVVPEFRFDLKRISFNRKYLSKYKNQVQNLKTYARALLYLRVTGKLLENIGTLIRHYEAMFSSMPKAQVNLAEYVEMIEDRYQVDQPTEKYICASTYHLRSLYDEAHFVYEDQATDPKLYDPIAEGVFESALSELETKEKTKNMDTRTKNLFAEKLAASMQNLFQTAVVDQFVETVKHNAPSLDLSAYQAVERECRHRMEIRKDAQRGHTAKWTKKEMDEERKSLFNRVYDKAAPLLKYNDRHVQNPLNANDDGEATWVDADFWGINEQNWEEINQATMNRALAYLSTSDTQNPGYVTSDRYSKYEICCYRAIYCGRLSEIPKFSEDEETSKKAAEKYRGVEEATDDSGVFYKNYSRRIRKMLNGMYNKPDEGLTPHLDKRWHSAEYLPMISTYRQAKDASDAARAFWLGILFEGIRDQKNMQTGKDEACARFIKKSEDGSTSEEVEKERPLLYNGKPVSMARPFLVYKALQQDTLSVSKTIGTYEGELEKERDFSELGLMEPGSFSTASLSKTPLLKTMAEKTNPLTVMRAIIMDRQAGDEEKKTLVDELKRILDEYTAGLQSDTLKRKVLHIIFESSCFADPKKRAGAETAYSPYFDVIAAEYDEAKAKAAKKAALEAAKAKRAKSKTSKPAAPRKRKTT